jgi:hypothetical protein
MVAELFRTNTNFRVWAMTPTYHDGYVAIEPVFIGTSAAMTTDNLRNLVHDITAATRRVETHNDGNNKPPRAA